MQNDPELDAFDKLRIREIGAKYDQTPFAFLAQFQSIAANLEPDERIKLVMTYPYDDVELMKAVLSDPQANKICSLQWEYNREEDVNSIIPLLINNCPELASLRVDFYDHFVLDFLSSVLEHPCTKVKVLEMPPYTKGDLARFFAALEQSRVSAIALTSGAFPEGLYEYLTKDLLVRLEVMMDRDEVPSELMMSLANCTCLSELRLVECAFPEPTASALPNSITKLVFSYCAFVHDFDWSFLTDSNVRELHFNSMEDVDGNQLGDALAVCLRAKGLDKLRLYRCDFADETLAVVGIELGRIKRLDFGGRLNDASIKLIALALLSPNSEVEELVLEYAHSTMSGIEDHLVPALKHPNCNLSELSLWTSQAEHREAALKVESKFHNRLALFVLLQGQQIRRLRSPLKRLPVDLFRLVGQVLI
ncbi:hypothetical protein BASA81_013781 [Batrachochytrium salamandrivorans]|nr:hypothetical protein BASA81_013781 [Batrachochytrium salamandrivorans]